MNIRCKFDSVLLLFLLALLPVSIQAKEKDPVPPPPPLAKTGLANIYIDQSSDIQLEVSGRLVEPVTFLLRKPPRHGKLSDLRRTGRNTAVVTYTPLPGASPGDDIFTFAAKSPDSPVSAPASVWVRLMERPPVLEYQGSVDFGVVFLGDELQKTITVRNSGGGQAILQPNLNPPWTLAGDRSISIPAGTEKSLSVSFRPSEERDFSDRLRLSNDPKASIELRGTGVAPLAWQKAGVIFSPEQRITGFAEFTLTNKTSSDRSARIEWPEIIQAEHEMVIPASGSATIKLSVNGSVGKVFQGSATVRSGNFTSQLPVTVYPQPARLKTDPESRLDLGKVPLGKPAHGSFVVKNVGESDSSLTILASDGLTIMPDSRSLILSPGMEQSFEISLAKIKPGKGQGQVTIRIPSQDIPIQLEVVAEAVGPENAALPVENFLRLPEQAPAAGIQASPLPPVASAWLLGSSEHEVSISWDVPSAEYSSFKIVRRVLSAPGSAPGHFEWRNWPEVDIQVLDGKATARWKNLLPNSSWVVQIIGIDRQGNPGPPSPAFKISTIPEKRVTIPPWAWALLVAALTGLALRLYALRKKSLLERENARIQALELERKT